jgi:hypothetical protein
MPQIPTSSQLGELRVEIPTFWFRSADDVRIEIAGTIATYSVDDTEKFNVCYQNANHAAARILGLVTPSVRAFGHTLKHDALHEMSGRLPRFLRDKGIDHLQDCGVELNSVDYSGANLTRVTQIVCDSTSTDPDCVEQ